MRPRMRLTMGQNFTWDRDEASRLRLLQISDRLVFLTITYFDPHQRSSSIKDLLPSKFFFNQRSFSIKSCLPSRVYFQLLAEDTLETPLKFPRSTFRTSLKPSRNNFQTCLKLLCGQPAIPCLNLQITSWAPMGAGLVGSSCVPWPNGSHSTLPGLCWL